MGSYFHQLRPMDSALSTEQMSKRIRIVSNSTFANETRISPAITSPLSRTRSRISSRLAVPETEGTLCIISQGKYRRDRSTLESARPVSPHPNEPSTNCQPFDAPICRFVKIPEGGETDGRIKMHCCRLQGWPQTSAVPGVRKKLLFIQQVPQRPQFQVQVFRLQPKSCRQLVDFSFQPHQRLSHLLNLRFAQ